MMEDRSGLWNEIQNFSQRKLKKVETNVVTASGDKLVEKRSAKGLKSVGDENRSSGKENEPNRKLDLQVGLILPGFMIGSHDVAHHKKTLDEFGITHILNLASNNVDNLYEDEYNYLSQNIVDSNSTNLKPYLDEIFDFIDSGRHAGSCLVHCDGSKPGLSRSTAVCIAYLMYKEKKGFNEAFNEVKEARAFVKPNDGFIDQLKKMEKEYVGKKEKEEIEDPFTKKKRMEIEAEKAMLKGATSVKNKLQMFKKVEDDDKTRAPTPNKLKADWKFGDNQDTSDSGAQIDGQTERSAPKKLTSILSIFQSKDSNAPARTPRPVVQPNTGAAKKWKPVETKGLQRTKDPQVNRDPHRDYCAYERVKKSKSGTKWASKKDSLKRQKSKEAAIKEANQMLYANDDKRKAPVQDNRAPRNIPDNRTVRNPPEAPSNSIMNKASLDSRPKTMIQPQQQQQNSTPMMRNDMKPKSPSIANEPKKSEPVVATMSIPKPPPPPPADLFDPKPNKISNTVPKATMVTPQVNKDKFPSKSPEKQPIKKPEIVPQKVPEKVPEKVTEKVQPKKITTESRPTLRRRPSQENEEPQAAEPVYPWRRRRRSSDLTGQVGPRRRSITAESPSPKVNQISQPKFPVQPEPPKAMVRTDVQQPPTRFEMKVECPTPVQPEPTPEAPKPKVFGLRRPKAKNIVGGSIWSADERIVPKSETSPIRSPNNLTQAPQPASKNEVKPSSLSSTTTTTPTPTPTNKLPITTKSISNTVQEEPRSINVDPHRSTGNFNGNSVKNVQQSAPIKSEMKKVEPIRNEDRTEAKKENSMTDNKSNQKILKKSVTIQSDSSESSEEEEEEDEEEEEEDETEEEESEEEEQPQQQARGGLTRSSTAEILKLIKSKTKAELSQNMDVIEEDGEIDVLLNELEKEGIENIDWGELGVDLDEVKEIVEKAPQESEGSDDEEEESEEEENEEEEEDEEEKEIAKLLDNLDIENLDPRDLNLSDRESPLPPRKDGTKNCKSSKDDDEDDERYEETIELIVESD